MDIGNKEEFIYFMQRACEDQSNDCYIELYNILLRYFPAFQILPVCKLLELLIRAFVCADCDFDGQVNSHTHTS